MGGSLARVLLPNPVATTVYDAGNRQVGFGDKTMVYDPNGNLVTLSDGTSVTTYTWDARNRLVASHRSDLDFQARYDTANRRSEHVLNGQSTVFWHDGADVVQTLTTGSDPVPYLTSLAIDEPFLRAGSQAYLTDALGSVVALVDESGTVTQEYRYTPFGRTEASGSSSGNPFQFTGRELDRTGLYYYRERYYNPETKRFLSEDPLGLMADINSYAYVGNNPTGFTDPFGVCRDPGGKGVRVCVQTFIPTKTTSFGLFKGDDRSFDPAGGNYRTTHFISVDLQGRTSEANHDTGITEDLFGRKRKAAGSSLKEAVEVSGGRAVIRVAGDESNPFVPGFVPGSPGITYEFKILVSDKGEMCVSGSHDGYPAYEIYVYRDGHPPLRLYEHDPRITGDNELSLFNPVEHHVRRCK